MSALLLGLVFALPTPGAAEAEAIPAEALQAIGRLNNAGYKTRRMCSATLVAPDKVVTAAHCVPEAPALREGMRFVAGWDRGEFAAVRGVAAVAYHPSFTGPTVENIPFDIAVLTLDAAITKVTPLPLGLPTDGAHSMTGYTNSRPHLISELGPCPTRLLSVETVLRIDCPTERGFSGGPVLSFEGGAWSVIAVTSASNEASTFAVRVDGWAAEVLVE